MPKQKIEWDERHSAAVNARRVLPRLAAAYFDEVRNFLAESHEPAELHRMRLASKRFRYTLELFRRCYGPALEQRLDALKKIQDYLGDLNDAVATHQHLGNSVNPKVREFLRARAQQKAEEFRQHWKAKFDADGQEKWWTQYLERNARTPATLANRRRTPRRRASSA